MSHGCWKSTGQVTTHFCEQAGWWKRHWICFAKEGPHHTRYMSLCCGAHLVHMIMSPNFTNTYFYGPLLSMSCSKGSSQVLLPPNHSAGNAGEHRCNCALSLSNSIAMTSLFHICAGHNCTCNANHDCMDGQRGQGLAQHRPGTSYSMQTNLAKTLLLNGFLRLCTNRLLYSTSNSLNVTVGRSSPEAVCGTCWPTGVFLYMGTDAS